MYRYYKITREMAEKLGVIGKAKMHPDGMYLVTPGISRKVVELYAKETGVHLLAEEAFEAIGAIGLSIAEAHASYRGELRHDHLTEENQEETTENGDDTETGLDREDGDS